MSILIPNLQARRHLLALSGLSRPPHRAWDRAALGDAIAEMGFVQVDSINTVERAHHHILFARSQAYRPRDLSALIEKDRVLFENWTHDASIIPTDFFVYWRHRFAREKTRLRERWKTHFGREDFQADIDRVLEAVTLRGPVMARDFEGDKPNTGWWDWHPSKAALEYLWRTGELSIARREGFQKVYDLSERVIPPTHWSQKISGPQFVDWACRSALTRLGFATRGEMAAFWELLTPDQVAHWIADNRAMLRPVAVASADGSKPRAALALDDGTVEAAMQAAPAPDRVRILSPFDPLLRDRKRTERLFGFHYRIEIFVPEAKRRYGYYVFPVLRGERIIGRIDMKAARDRDVLAVRAFWPEPGTRLTSRTVSLLEAELYRMARFAGVARVEHADGWLRAPMESVNP